MRGATDSSNCTCVRDVWGAPVSRRTDSGCGDTAHLPKLRRAGQIPDRLRDVAEPFLRDDPLPVFDLTQDALGDSKRGRDAVLSQPGAKPQDLDVESAHSKPP